MKIKKIKKLLFIFILSCMTCGLFAVEEYVITVYKKIDDAFSNKSDSELNDVLAENNEDKNYPLMENYTVKQIRRLIINNDYEFALSATIVVIENNLENESAVLMYDNISKAYEDQQNYEIQQEELRQKEIARVEQVMESKRGAAEKEYIGATTVSGETVYVSGRETKKSSYRLRGSFGMLDVGYYSNSYYEPAISDIDDGITVDVLYEYQLDDLTFGFDVFGALKFLTVPIDANNINKESFALGFNVMPKIAFNRFSKNLFLRFGIDGDVQMLTIGEEIETIRRSVISPAIGIKLENLKIGAASLDMNVDWIAAHLFKMEEMKFSGAAGLNLSLPFAELEKIKLMFNFGLRDRFYLLSDNKIENKVNINIGFGVENVIQ